MEELKNISGTSTITVCERLYLRDVGLYGGLLYRLNIMTPSCVHLLFLMVRLII